jgi:thymidylate synthase
MVTQSLPIVALFSKPVAINKDIWLDAVLVKNVLIALGKERVLVDDAGLYGSLNQSGISCSLYKGSGDEPDCNALFLCTTPRSLDVARGACSSILILFCAGDSSTNDARVEGLDDFNIDSQISLPGKSAPVICKYTKSIVPHDEYCYIKEANHILSLTNIQNSTRMDRTNVGTYSVFGQQLKFNISKSVPVITTKQLAWKAVIKEFLWFLKGKTDSKELEKEGVNIWKLNTTREFLDGRGLSSYQEGDVGPMYGFVWRHAHATYSGCSSDYQGCGHDQITWLIQQLKDDPFSRRHIITTYIPEYKDQGVLFPCHGIVTQMYVEEDSTGEKHLSCHTYCRSQDVFLGQPFNIASYAVFTHLIAKLSGMRPKELIISTGDTHVYANHVTQMKEQVQRTPFPFPQLVINDSVLSKSLDDIDLADFQVIGYLHHPSIKAPMAV